MLTASRRELNRRGKGVTFSAGIERLGPAAAPAPAPRTAMKRSRKMMFDTVPGDGPRIERSHSSPAFGVSASSRPVLSALAPRGDTAADEASLAAFRALSLHDDGSNGETGDSSRRRIADPRRRTEPATRRPAPSWFVDADNGGDNTEHNYNPRDRTNSWEERSACASSIPRNSGAASLPSEWDGDGDGPQTARHIGNTRSDGGSAADLTLTADMGGAQMHGSSSSFSIASSYDSRSTLDSADVCRPRQSGFGSGYVVGHPHHPHHQLHRHHADSPTRRRCNSPAPVPARPHHSSPALPPALLRYHWSSDSECEEDIGFGSEGGDWDMTFESPTTRRRITLSHDEDSLEEGDEEGGESAEGGRRLGLGLGLPGPEVTATRAAHARIGQGHERHWYGRQGYGYGAGLVSHPDDHELVELDGEEVEDDEVDEGESHEDDEEGEEDDDEEEDDEEEEAKAAALLQKCDSLIVRARCDLTTRYDGGDGVGMKRDGGEGEGGGGGGGKARAAGGKGEGGRCGRRGPMFVDDPLASVLTPPPPTRRPPPLPAQAPSQHVRRQT